MGGVGGYFELTGYPASSLIKKRITIVQFFQCEMFLVRPKSTSGCEAVCRLIVLFSDDGDFFDGL